MLLQGGVLEPQGVVEIKYRAADMISTMHRIDPVIMKLKVQPVPHPAPLSLTRVS